LLRTNNYYFSTLLQTHDGMTLCVCLIKYKDTNIVTIKVVKNKILNQQGLGRV